MRDAALTLAAPGAHTRAAAGSGGTPTRRYIGLHPIRNGRTREEVSSSQRGRLFAATLATVAERGYERSTVSALCHRAGVSKKTLYEHFPTKEALFLATYDLVAYRTLERVRAACEEASSPEERVGAGFDALARAFAQRPDDAQLMLVEALAAGRGAVARCDRTARELTRVLLPVGADRVSGGAPDPVLAAGLVGGVLWALRLSLWDARRRRCVEDDLGAGALTAARDPRGVRWSELLDGLREWVAGCDLGAAAVEVGPAARGSERPAGGRLPVGDGERAVGGLRETLLDAALSVAARSGCEDLTVAQIAECAGCSREQFFTEFADCQECVLAAVRERVQVGARRVATACAGAADQRTAARAGARALVEHFIGQPEMAQVACVEVFTLGRAGREQLFAALDELAGPLAERLRADGCTPCQRQALARSLVGAGYEVVRVGAIGDGESFIAKVEFSINRSCGVDKATLG